MKKPGIIRELVMAAEPTLQADQLMVFVDDGKVVTSDASVRYEAAVIVHIADWPGAIDLFAFALGRYLLDYEPDQPRDALRFEVTIISHQLADVRFRVPFSELVAIDGAASESCVRPLPDLAQMVWPLDLNTP